MRRLLCLSACMMAITALLGACTMSRLDMHYGTSYRLAIVNQVLDPDAERNLEPVYGMNGIAAKNVIDTYYKGFEEKKTAAPTYTIPIGRIAAGQY